MIHSSLRDYAAQFISQNFARLDLREALYGTVSPFPKALSISGIRHCLFPSDFSDFALGLAQTVQGVFFSAAFAKFRNGKTVWPNIGESFLFISGAVMSQTVSQWDSVELKISLQNLILCTLGGMTGTLYSAKNNPKASNYLISTLPQGFFITFIGLFMIGSILGSSADAVWRWGVKRISI